MVADGGESWKASLRFGWWMVGYARRRSTGMKRMASVERASRSSGSSRRRN